jgi:hypothetical protein
MSTLPLRGEATLISIDRQAVLRRVNRRLRERGQQMFRSRSERAAREVGDWYIIDFKKSSVTGSGLQLEECARQLGALRAWERLDEEEVHSA